MFPVGRSASAPMVLGVMLLSECSWVCTYSPKSYLNCRLVHNVWPVTMVRGLNDWDMPSSRGKEFNQKFSRCASSITNRGGTWVNGNILMVARMRSFNTRLYRSISPTCSSSATSFSVTFISNNSVLKQLKAPSINTYLTRKPEAWYMAITCLIDFRRVFFFKFGISSTVPKPMFRDRDTKNAMRFTCITSPHNVTSWYRSNTERGRGV